MLLFALSQLLAFAARAQAPNAPTTLAAQADHDTVKLTWTAPSDDGNGSLDGYNVYRCEEGLTACTPVWIAWVQLSDGESYTDDGLTADTDYRYAVGSSRNSELSVWSNQVVVTAVDPGAPTAFDAEAEPGYNALTWTAPAADDGGSLDGYNVYRCEEGMTACTPVWIAWVQGGGTTWYSDGNLTTGTTYRYAVGSSRAGATSSWSNQDTATALAPATPPGAPTGLSVQANPGHMALSWTAPADDGNGALDGYNVYRCEQGEGDDCTPVWIAWVQGRGTTSYTDSNLTTGTAYRYAVGSSRAGEGSTLSNEETATALAPPPAPGAPTALKVSSFSETAISLSWTAPADDGNGALDGYNVYRCEEGTTPCTPVWIAWVQGGGTSGYTDSSVTTGSTYRYALGSYRANQGSSWSNEVTATAEALELNVSAVAGDNTINIDEKGAGFSISGDTGSVGGVSVTVTVGSTDLTATSSTADPATWSVSVPADASYITGASVDVEVNASKTGSTSPSAVERTLTVDLTAPTAPTYTAPSSLRVGVAITEMNPSGGTGIDEYSATGLPSGLSINSDTGAISGTPDMADASTADATITASDTAGNTDTVDITFPAVAKRDQTLTGFQYSASSVTFDSTAPTVTPPSGVQTTLSYSATPSTVCTINPSTGALTIVGVGSCQITATAAGTDDYNEATATFTVTVQAAGTLVLNVSAVTGDNTINIDEKGAGFSISGDTGSVGGVSVTVTVGSTDLTATSSTADPATWSVSVPADASYITGASVDVEVNASKTGSTSPSAVERTLTVDLTAPTAPTYTAPSSLRVGVAITEMNPSGGTGIDEYSATGLPSGLSINSGTGAINGTPDMADASTADATITASDTAGNTDTADITFPAVAKRDQTLTGFQYSASTVTFGSTAPTVTPPSGVQTTLGYSATPSTVCTINPSTGALTIVGAGSCQITATAAGTDDYNEATATFTVTVQAAVAPGVPTGLGAQGTDSKVVLNWTEPVVKGSGGLSGYTLYRGNGNACDNLSALSLNIAANAISVEDTTVTTNSTYCYEVTASSVLGGEGSRSASVVAKATDPGAPSVLAAQGAASKVVLSWAAPLDDGGGEVDGYNVYRCAGSETSCDGNTDWLAWVDGAGTTTYTDDGSAQALTSGLTYRYAVVSSRASALSTWSNQPTVRTVDPSAGALMVSSASATAVGLTWAAPSDDGGGSLDGYNVYRCDPESTCTPVWIDWVPLSDGESYTDDDVTEDTAYRYAVGSSRTGALSTWSNQVTVVAKATTRPGAPTQLMAQATGAGAMLSWTAPADDGGGALDGYNVYRCDPGDTCTPVWIAWASGTSYTDSGVTPGTEYRYAITSSRNSLISGQSNQVTVTAVGAPAPLGPVALMVDSASATVIGLTWTAPAGDGHGALDGYNVFRCDPGDSCTPEWLDWVPLSDGESYTDDDVTENTAYRYAVASTRNDLVSSWTNQVTVVAKATTRPGTPTQLRVQDLGGRVRLSWTAPSADGGDALDGYNVYRCEQAEGGSVCSPAWVAWAPGTSYTDSGLTPGTEHRYVVTASRNSLLSGQSNQVTVVARAPRVQLPSPRAPVALMVESASATAIVLRWTKPANDRYGSPGSYAIYRCEQGEGDACLPVYIGIAFVAHGERYTDDDVIENTAYRYTVASFRDGQFSARSNQVTVVAKASSMPGAPTQLIAQAAGSGVTLSWTAPADDGGGALDGYNVYRCEHDEGEACVPDWIAWVSLSDAERYTDSGLSAETEYRYAVTSSRNGLISEHSTAATVTALAAPAPSGPVALVVVSASATAIGLNWTAPADDGHGALDGYNIFRCEQGDGEACSPEWIAWIPLSDGESYTDEDVTQDTGYRYAVASTRNDVVSAWSGQITVVAKASSMPGAPTQLMAQAAGSVVTLSWTAPADDGGGALDGYNVYRCEQGEGGACVPDWIAWVSLSDAERYTDSGLSAETEYRYAVTSSRNGLISEHSTAVTVTALATPAPAGPVALMVESASATAIALSWTAPADDGHGALDGYNVYRCDPGDTCTPDWIAWVPLSDGERYTDEDVTEDTGYRYAVASTRNDVVSAWSGQITVVAKASSMPGVPTQLTARADGSNVTLTWTAPSDDGGGALDGYSVYRCEQGEGEACAPEWIAWVSLSDAERYTDSGLSAETEYRYAVTSSRNGLISRQSTPVIVTAEAAPPPPPAPGNLMVISTSFYSIQLGWTAPPDDGGGALDGYNVYRCEQGEGEACTPEWIDWVADGSGYADSGVTAESDYRYAVASSRAGTISAWSNQVSATAEAAPAGPVALMVESASATAIGLSWTAPADDGHGALHGYNVYRCDPGDACTPDWIAWVPLSDGERYTDEDVTEDTGYRYAVASTRNDVVSAWSGQITVVAKASSMPGAPTQLMAQAAGSGVTLSWTAPADDGGGALDGYNVYRCEQGDGEACVPDWIAWVSLSDAERYTDSGLSAETEYRYAVTSSRNGLISEHSTAATVTALAAPAPSGPVALVVVSASATAIGLNWTAPADDGHGALDGYNIFRCEQGDGEACSPEWIAWIPLSDGESYTDEDVTQDTGYRYAVASTRNDLVSPWSNQGTVVAKASTRPRAPTQLSAEVVGLSVRLSWTAPSDDGGGALDGYNVYRCDPGDTCTPEWIAWVSLSDGERFTDSGVTPGIEYRYALTSSRNSLISAWSNHVKAVAASDAISPAETQVMDDVSVSMARSMLSSIVPTISRRFTAETGASEMSLAGRNITPNQFVERLSSATGHNGDPIPAHRPGNFPPSTGESSQHHSDRWDPAEPAVGTLRYAGTMGSSSGARSSVVSGRRLLTDSRFAAGVGPTGQAGRSWTVWGSGDIQQFSGNSDGGGKFEGNVRTGHLGADVPFGDNHLFGIAVAHSVGDADFATADRTGHMGIEVTTVLPYARFLFNDRTDAWVILGAGWGERSTVIGDSLPQLVDLVPQLAAFGGRHALASPMGGIDWSIQADAASVRLVSDDDFSASTERVRLGLEGSSTFALGNAGTVRPFVELNVRVDDRTDSTTESGFELVSGALYKHSASGFWLETRGRIFVLRTEGKYEERGFSVTAGLQPRTDGTGLSLRLSPQWGAPVTNTPAFWRDDALGETFGLRRGKQQQGESLRAELSYGLLAPRTDAIVTPFGELNILSETRRRARLGTRYHHSTDIRELSLELSSDILMTTTPGAGLLETGIDSRYELWLKGKLLF